MNKIIALALLVAGIVLLVYGINANHSLASGVSKALTGSPTDRALWLMVSGAVLTALGLGGLFYSRA